MYSINASFPFVFLHTYGMYHFYLPLNLILYIFVKPSKFLKFKICCTVKHRAPQHREAQSGGVWQMLTEKWLKRLNPSDKGYRSMHITSSWVQYLY